MTWVLARRAEGLSHRLVARALYNRTNGRIDVTHETIRNWIGAEAKAA